MKKILLITALASALAMPSFAQTNPIGNPYLPLWEHLPDGEPRVFEDPDNPGHYRIYIIGSHDVRTNEYCGPDIHAWSAPVDDLSQWRDDGPIYTFQNPANKEWDVMFAPDLVEVEKNGKKEYYLYPHPRGWRRIAFCCKSSRPDGPFTPINAETDQQGVKAKDGACLGFDPSVFVDKVVDPKDPDSKTGYRVYGYWGFQHSSAVQLDPDNMYTPRPGTQIIDPFIPASTRYGELKDDGKTSYPAVAKGEDLKTFNFFEASSIRKVGNKYVMVYSGYSGPDYGLSSTNSALRYAYSDSPLGPWKGGGVLVDSRAVVLNENGTELTTTFAGHNTHGSLQQINGQWYVFYHRAPRGNGWARQAMVAPVKIETDLKLVTKGGKVSITGFNPYSDDNTWTAKASNGNIYKGAEVTSEGFYMYGLPPYAYYSAGYACYVNHNSTMQDNWDNWTNDMIVNLKNGGIVGFKYFGFGGLKNDCYGIKAFEGVKDGNNTKLDVFLTPKTNKSFKIKVMLDGPYANNTWNGKELGTIIVPTNSYPFMQKFSLDVSSIVDKLDKKHAIFLICEGDGDQDICELAGIGFSNKNYDCKHPDHPAIHIAINGDNIDMPQRPTPSTNENGYTDIVNYNITFKAGNLIPHVTAKCSSKNVSLYVKQAKNFDDEAVVTGIYNGVKKVYHIKFDGKAY